MKSDLIYGKHPIKEALEEGKSFDKIFVQRGTDGEFLKTIKSLAFSRNIPLQIAPQEKLNRITRKNHQGIAGFLSPIDFYKIEDVLPHIYEQGETPLLLILDGITDVRNFGAIARTAVCTGAHAIIIFHKNAAPANADALKTSAGALAKIQVCRERSAGETIDFLQLNGVQILASDLRAQQFNFELDSTPPTAIVLGSEDEGISREFITKADQLFKIPQTKKMNSYNVSVSAGIVLYETMKQRMTLK